MKRNAWLGSTLAVAVAGGIAALSPSTAGADEPDPPPALQRTDPHTSPDLAEETKKDGIRRLISYISNDDVQLRDPRDANGAPKPLTEDERRATIEHRRAAHDTACRWITQVPARYVDANIKEWQRDACDVSQSVPS